MPGRVSNSRANMANRNKGKKRKPTKKSDAQKRGEILAHVISAEDLSKGPICRLIVPQQIPPGFHSSFVLPENL